MTVTQTDLQKLISDEIAKCLKRNRKDIIRRAMARMKKKAKRGA